MGERVGELERRAVCGAVFSVRNGPHNLHFSSTSTFFLSSRFPFHASKTPKSRDQQTLQTRYQCSMCLLHHLFSDALHTFSPTQRLIIHYTCLPNDNILNYTSRSNDRRPQQPLFERLLNTLATSAPGKSISSTTQGEPNNPSRHIFLPRDDFGDTLTNCVFVPTRNFAEVEGIESSSSCGISH